MRHEQPDEAHALPPHTGTALPLSCGEADNPSRQTGHNQPDPVGFSGQGGGPLSASITARLHRDGDSGRSPSCSSQHRLRLRDRARHGVRTHPRRAFQTQLVTV